ncbi:uncharacterized protein LOC123306857 [Coccinella septempunctata]|uniref:uncharacterized protein LOC123306857 n=1 Tax=Coccinella septempunctata TaxID=41139 RepID=UPI001D07319B|nr:uncharacterized protein LOC123306857 [Coccinella septempunctata]
MSDDSTNKAGPGPATYYLPSTIGHNNHDISKSRSPSFSMGVRLPGLFCDQNVQSPSPGPKYQVEYMTKYGKANVIPSNFSLKTKRPRSSAGKSRSSSTDRNAPRNSNSLPRNCTNLESHSNIRSNNNYEKRKSVKVGDSKMINLSNELKAFCREFGDSNTVPKSRISSERRNSTMPPRYRNDIRQQR